MLSSITTITTFSSGLCVSAPDAFRLLFVGDGQCHIALDTRSEHLIGDRMLLLRGEVTYRVEEPSDDLLLTQLDFSHIPCADGASTLGQLYRHYPDYRAFCADPESASSFHDRHSLVRFTAKSLAQYATYEPPYRNQFLSATLQYLTLVIASAIHDIKSQPGPYNRHVRKAIHYMHDHYMRGTTAEDIATHVGIHPGHLHRLFRAETGMRVSEYIIQLRLEKAKTLLKRTEIPIATIAHFTGVSTQQYLCRLFKTHIGMTPQAYRRSYNITCNYQAAYSGHKTFTEGLPREAAE